MMGRAAEWRLWPGASLLVGVLALGMAMGAGASGSLGVRDGRPSVAMHEETTSTREDYLRLWARELAKNGERLPAGYEQMTTTQIIRGWTRERAKHTSGRDDPMPTHRRG